MEHYLSDVKSEVRDTFLEFFEKAWREVVEPAIRQTPQTSDGFRRHHRRPTRQPEIVL